MSKNEREVYDVLSAIKLIRESKKRKFDETLDFGCEINIGSSKDQVSIRGSVDMPAGTGKKVVVAVFCADSDKFDEIKKAGADYVGAEDLVDRFKSGEISCDVCLASPDAMIMLAKISKILGPKKLMPSPKSGTVSNDIVNLVLSFKKGKVVYKADAQGNIYAGIGRISFSDEDLILNFNALFDDVLSKAPSVKSLFVKRVFLSSTMGSSSFMLDKKSLKSGVTNE
ncbi:50S ribosomal protein L1 [Candidatus Cytomitobacter indipagum]|uniref:50S ribosomal protein L1 n=1 Tax=Candidatus Cytomitobacter indipagum TaxID=2601575 RepID=UPI00155A60FA|nr:50S ribosomal protein L1 [Candidatus Cytomitobacter indipagum]